MNKAQIAHLLSRLNGMVQVQITDPFYNGGCTPRFRSKVADLTPQETFAGIVAKQIVLKPNRTDSSYFDHEHLCFVSEVSEIQIIADAATQFAERSKQARALIAKIEDKLIFESNADIATLMADFETKLAELVK